DDFIGIDLDGCRDPETGDLEPWAAAVYSRFSGTYAEVSPSGTGIKIFARTTHTWDTRNQIDATADNKYGKTPQIEVYQAGRFFCVTGEQYGECSEVTNQDDATAWLKRCFVKKLGQQ